MEKISSNALRAKYFTSKTKIYRIDETWSLEVLDVNEHGPENSRGFGYVLAVIDTFRRFGWIVAIKSRNA